MQFEACSEFHSFIHVPDGRVQSWWNLWWNPPRITSQQWWKAMAFTACRELWGWYLAVEVMLVAKQIAILPLPSRNKKQFWIFSITTKKAKASWDFGHIWAFWNDKWDTDGNCTLWYIVDLGRLPAQMGIWMSRWVLMSMLDPKVNKGADLVVLTWVGSVAAKSKEEKDKQKEQIRFWMQLHSTGLNSTGLLSHGNAFGRCLCLER